MSSSAEQQLAPRLSTSSRGCHHCVACSQLTFAEAALSRSRGASSEWQEWWPAGLQSPTVYFYLRAKQLRYLLRHGGSDARELWRPFRECDYRCCAMLRRRGRPPLAIHVPAAQTGIDQTLDNEPHLVRCVAVPLCPAAVPPTTCGLAPSPFSGPAAAVPLSTAALTAAKLAPVAALAASASTSAASLAPTTTAQQLTGGGSADGGRPLRHSWRALAAELQALASPARSSSSGDSSQGLMALSGSAESSLASLALSGSGESSQGSLALSGSPSPASVLRTRAAALPPRPPLAPALARLDCASARWQKAKEQLLVAQAQAQPQPPPHPQPKQQGGAQARVANPGAGALGSSCQAPEPWATARVPSVPMLPV